jgi:hypothetical protein
MRNLKWFAGFALGAALAASSSAFANVTHIVAFKYKASVTSAQKADFAQRFLALRHTARRNGQPYIVSITGGHESSREGFDDGMEQIFVVTFKTADDRDYFVGKPYRDAPDPAHGALMPVVMSMIDQDKAGKPTLFVLDYDDTAAR